jgi:hypothetical protein
MGRMHSNGKGVSRSALPYKRTSPSWLKITASEVCSPECRSRDVAAPLPLLDPSLLLLIFCYLANAGG